MTRVDPAVEIAHGRSLDILAHAHANMHRRPQETDDHLRARLKREIEHGAADRWISILREIHPGLRDLADSASIALGEAFASIRRTRTTPLQHVFSLKTQQKILRRVQESEEIEHAIATAYDLGGANQEQRLDAVDKLLGELLRRG